MKKFIIAIAFLIFISPAFAASYPASCPTEARSILNAVGGCSSVKKSQYPTVYEKCCAMAKDVPNLAPATQTQKLVEAPQSENKPLGAVKSGFQRVFNRILRLFRFR